MSLHPATGYVIDTEYTRHVYPEMFPRRLAYLCAIRGRQSILQSPDAPFTYCDLGCGAGISTAAMAAVNPQGRFFGVDLNPAHIARGSAFAAAAGIDNVSFIEATFADLLHRTDLPDFDVIALHGVYSWIGAEHRTQILDVIHRRLRPGGLVYVSYNVMPGWAAAAPLRRLMIERTHGLDASSATRAELSLELLQESAAHNGKYVREHPALADFIDRMSQQPLPYIVHEYLNKDWEPHYSADVAREMAEAGLRYLADGEIKMNYLELIVDGAARRSIDAAPNSHLRGMLRDFAVNNKFRRDLFVHDADAQIRKDRKSLLAPFYFTALRRTAPPPSSVRLGSVVNTLPGFAGDIFTAALRQPLGIDALSALARDRDIAFDQMLDALELLVACDFLQVAAAEHYAWREPDPPRRIAMSPLNQALLADCATQFENGHLVSPVLGGALPLDALPALLLWAMSLHESDIFGAALGVLSNLGLSLNDGDRPLEGRDEHIAYLEREFQRLRTTTLPQLLRAGILIDA